ncbi:MAG: hypothetical protein AAFR65_04780 [Pseudomonadota bacterium]
MTVTPLWRAALLALLVYLLGDKIVVVVDLITFAWNEALGNEHKPRYQTAMSLAALGVGVAVISIAAVWQESDDLDLRKAVLVGLVLGLTGGVLETLKAALIDRKGDEEDVLKWFLFFGLYLMAILGPLLAVLTTGQRRLFVDAVLRFSWTTVLAAFVGLLVYGAVGGIVLALPLFSDASDIASANQQLVFRASTLVIIGSLWATAMVAPIPEWHVQLGPVFRLMWRSFYCVAAFVVSVLYARETVGACNPYRVAAVLPVELSYGLVGLAPLLAVALLGGKALSSVRGVLKISGLASGLTSFAMLLGLGHLESGSWSEVLVVVTLQGFAAALIAPVAGLAVKLSDQLRQEREGQKT